MAKEEAYPEKLADRPIRISETTNTDSELRKKVYQTLKNDCLINSERVNVRVSSRTVYLEGVVDSEKERNIAYDAVMDIFGVRNVVNYLTFPCPYLIRNRALAEYRAADAELAPF